MIVNIEEDPRHAGQITRYHTWSVHRNQSVGEHSWQIIRIAVTIWPECPRHLFLHAVLHDIGEMAGDIPWPGKRNDPVLRERITLAELRVHRAMSARWNLPPPVRLSEMEQNFFKMCEYIEMWEFGLMEQNMGNKYGTIVSTRMMLEAAAVIGKMHPDIQKRARAYCDIRKEQESEIEQPTGEQT
jgi:hypothetical protein